MGQRGYALWFTGMSGAGKSTLSAELATVLRDRGLKVEVLDGDEVRTNLSKGLGFSKEDRDTNVRRIAYVARLLARNGVVAIGAAISPYKETRDQVRDTFPVGSFVEVFVHCPLETLIERDPKGLYARALKGELKHFTGIDDPYEPPDNPEVIVNTGVETVESGVRRILSALELMGLVPRVDEQRADLVHERLRAVGQG
ncbi:MAG: adenylyl-sulfate kinase [Deltaproteobacteria bacterium]|nr:adenylyl-sulfate kinase [Deltaproteobacteria bacterium]MCB9787775.1 adenylyl-sulfate kinase [Deltaproteobacteria bacterium]